MSLIFGYDELQGNGNPITNAFEFKNNISPINLGYAGYRTDATVRDNELNLVKNKFSTCHRTHSHQLSHFFDIKIKKVDQIKEKYYYVIDVFTHDFWKHSDAKHPTNISKQAITDIRSGKAKILVLFPKECLRNHDDISGLLNTWVANYNLPHKSIVLVSGNYSYGDSIEKDKCISYIPFSMWENEFKNMYNIEATQEFNDAIINKKSREKVYLNYNRRARYARCKLVYDLKAKNVFKHGFVSLGKHAGEDNRNIPIDFFNELPITFDDTDLEINHAVELVKKDFLDSYVSLVSETSVEVNEIFQTEKIFKPIVTLHPFIVLASPGFLKQMKKFRYKTFSKWFDESYDLEIDLDTRIGMIVKEIKKLVLKSDLELQNMLLDMLPTLRYNLNTFLRRTKQRTFQKQLEVELWK